VAKDSGLPYMVFGDWYGHECDWWPAHESPSRRPGWAWALGWDDLEAARRAGLNVGDLQRVASYLMFIPNGYHSLRDVETEGRMKR
jgi:hypothetical protein